MENDKRIQTIILRSTNELVRDFWWEKRFDKDGKEYNILCIRQIRYRDGKEPDYKKIFLTEDELSLIFTTNRSSA